jgi:hypothetical protein
MSVNSSAGAKFYFCSVASPTASTSSEYSGLTWTEVKDCETIGEFGDSAGQATFTGLSDSRVRKFKGAADAGDVAITFGRDPLDPGQIALKAAAGTKFNYAFKVALEDAADANDTDSTFYFQAQIMSVKTNVGGANDVTKLTANLSINSAILEVASTAVS